MTLLRGLGGKGTPPFVDESPLPMLVEGGVPKSFMLFPGLATMKGFLVVEGFVVVEGFIGMKGLVELTGLVGTDVFPLVSLLTFATFAHVLPQYGCTAISSIYLGLFLQYLGRHIVQQFPDCDQNAHAHITQRKGGVRPRVHVRVRARAADVRTGWQA